MKEPAVQPDVGYQEEHDGRHQDEVYPPDKGRRAGATVTQGGADSQLDEKETQGDGSQPEPVGQARRDVPCAKGRPGMPGRQGCKGQGQPVMRPKW